jgi:hypothetical protein
MPDTNIETSISDEVLLKAQEDINGLLKNKRLTAPERVQLEIQSYFLMFLVNDHKKISAMYPWIKEQQIKEEARTVWWNKLQWVIIPLIVSSVFIFIGQALYFWVTIVPELIAHH